MKTGKKVTVTEFECNRCFYRWWPRIGNEGEIVIPKTCANLRCKSKYWNKPRIHCKITK